MATFFAYTPFDISQFDLSLLNRAQTDIGFHDDTYETINGRTYQDIAGFEYHTHSTSSVYFGGTGIAFNAAHTEMIAGTITGIAQFDGFLGDFSSPDYILQGISLSAKSLSAAARTTSTVDDAGLLATALAGNDKFLLSNGNDYAKGFAGNDSLYGYGGSDLLVGGAGNDRLYGGTGDDFLVGDAGNDILNGGGGYDLASYVDSTSAITVDLRITTQQNTLGAGLDTLTGIEDIAGSRYGDMLIGNSASNYLTGNEGADVLSGNGGADFLFGGAGKDVLTGGAGKDFFVFDTALAPANVDLITDFSRADHDRIELAKAVFGQLSGTAGSYLASDEFYAAAGATAAHDASDRIVYNTTTGALYYDADGIGGLASAQIALLGNGTHPTLSYGDFILTI